ncbi:protein kinase domain-containing protein [Paenibacillus whitsoniae]|nr:LuxR C-terminal-related transcriptional regulator [Paenibacillus whitsoniae]
MLNVTGYHINQVIFEDATIVVCHATSDELKREVLLKIVKESHRAIIENAKLINEYEIAGSVTIPGIIKPLALLRQGNGLILASEWVHGLTLRHFTRSGPLDIPVFLRISIQIARVLEQLHKANVVHMNIRPDTIVVVPSALRVHLTGLGHAVLHVPDGSPGRSMPLIEGAPPYMAPERTGLLNRMIEGSSDLYSLGVTLYEALTGRLPFEAKDPLEWAHAHLARRPIHPSELRGEIPYIIEEIILKLLEKTTDRRYQSAYGLRADLERCLQSWEQNGVCEHFDIGTLDAPLMLDVVSGSPVNQTVHVQQRHEVESSTGGYANVLELAAVMRASQAFAEEKDSYHLLHKLMQITIEAAGAERGCFVSLRGQELIVEHIADARNAQATGSFGMPLANCTEVCQNLITYVALKRTYVILDQASRVGLYADDPYVLANQPQSILGLPVFAQGDLQGILYLENNYAPYVFSADRLGVLQMLSSQISYVLKLIGYYSAPQPLKDLIPAAALTEREREVLQFMAAGMSNKEIADRLIMSAGTVKVHMRNLFAKLQVNNRVKAVAAATQLNLLQEQRIAD